MPAQAGRWLRLSFGLYIAGIILMLLVVSPFTWMPSVFLKTSIAALCAALSLVVLFFSRLKTGTREMTRAGRLTLIFAALLPIAYLVSAWLSVDRSVALLGGGNEVDTLFFVGLGFAAFVGAFLLVRSPRAARPFLYLTVFAILAAVAFQYLNIFFGNALLPAALFSDKTVNLVGKWNDLGLLAALAALLLVARAECTQLSARAKIITALLLAVLALFLVVVNFSVAWWLLFGGVVLTLLFKWRFARADRRALAAAGAAAMGGRSRMWSAWFAGAVALISLVFIVWGVSLQQRLPSILSVSSLEVRPAFSTTYQIDQSIRQGSLRRAVFGAGPNTFGEAWLAFKPAAVNQTQFWNIDFITGFSVLSTALVTCGIFGVISWLIPLLMVLIGLCALLRRPLAREADQRTLLLGLGLMAVFLWVSMILYATSQDVALLAFASAGAFLGYMISTRAPQGESRPSSRLSRGIASLLFIILVIATLAITALIIRRLVAFSYEQSAAAALAESDISAAATLDARSQSIERTGQSLRLGVEIDLAALQQLASTAPTTTEDTTAAQARFKSLASDAIGQGVAAAELNPMDYQPYVELANVYGFLASLKVQGAYDNARQAYLQAIQRDPTNPSLPLLLARTEATQDLTGNLTEIQALVKQSLTLKNNYTDAFLLVEQIAVAQNDLNTAVQATKLAVQSAPDQASLWFELGLLYYAGNDMGDATPTLEQAVKLEPDYANAKYFLGLAYQKQGRNQDAIQQFTDIQKTNPDNAEVKLILSNLEAGHDPFAGATPPVTPTPTARAKAPIQE